MLRTFARIVTFTLSLWLMAACSDGGAAGPSAEGPARLNFLAIANPQIRTIIITVSGAGIPTDMVFNFPLDSTHTARGTISVPAGSVRRLVAVAVDSGGTTTHRADTTIRMVPGDNPSVAFQLKPLTGSTTIIVTLGSQILAFMRTDSTLFVNATVQFSAQGTGADGSPVPSSAIQWASSNPAVLTVDGAGNVTGVRAGTADLYASAGLTTIRRSIRVTPNIPPAGTLFVEQDVPGGGQLSLYRFSSGTSTLALPVNTGQGDLSPDGTQVVYWRPFDNRIFRASASGAGEVVLASGAVCYTPRWSFDGTKVTYTREVGGGEDGREIMLMNADGSGAVQLTSNGAADEQAQLSPDGTRVVFASKRDGNYEIYVMNSNGSGQTRLTTDSGIDWEPSWSPDGSRILFTSHRSGASELWSMNANGTGLQQLTSGSGVQQIGRWSPDGTRFAFRRTVAGAFGIYTARSDGGDVQLVRMSPTGVNFEYVRSWRAP